jgi:A/G-specific adenine glycosylase
MLQQTTVATVIPYYKRFLERWPTVDALAAAPETEVLREWAGLGYYRRARYLHACARAVVAKGGQFPKNAAGLIDLPGIGRYTAAAVAAMAFGERVVPIDGNVERVMSRFLAIDKPIKVINNRTKESGLKKIDETVHAWLAAEHSIFPGDFAQGLMDLGATLCTPRRPQCAVCPLADGCRARQLGRPEDYPVVPPKADKPTRYGTVTLYQAGGRKNEFFVITRPERGLLAAMPAWPSDEWTATPPREVNLGDAIGSIRHSFTHFNLVLTVCHRRTTKRDLSHIDGLWVSADKIKDVGMPKVFSKAWELWLQQQ